MDHHPFKNSFINFNFMPTYFESLKHLTQNESVTHRFSPENFRMPI